MVVVYPATFQAIAETLINSLSLVLKKEKKRLWKRVREKMARVPYNGYLEVWLQRVTQPQSVNIKSISEEPICKIVNGESPKLWENDWIASKDLKSVLDVKKIVVASASDMGEIVKPEEVELFKQNAWSY